MLLDVDDQSYIIVFYAFGFCNLVNFYVANLYYSVNKMDAI
jgi:hypothetical protein